MRHPLVSHPHEVLIGLAAGARLTTATGFDGVGRELAHVRIVHVADPAGAAPGYDPLAAWQAVRAALRGLADRIPDLARRAVGLAVTGAEGGLVAVDEDGDPLAVAIAPGVWAHPNPEPGPSSAAEGPASPLGWLARHHPEVAEQVAWLLPAKDWVHFCLTGVAAVEPTGADLGLGPPGAWRQAGLEGLLPEPPEGTLQTVGLARAAAGACRLRHGLPVVLAPPSGICAAIAGGALGTGPDIGFALLEDAGCYLLRPPPDTAMPAAGPGTNVALPCAAGLARVVVGAPVGDGLGWLSDLLQDALGEIGLIGTGQGELRALLLRRVEAADPAGLTFETTGGIGRFTGLARTTSIGDLARAVLEGVGLAARRVLADLGGPPAELRVAGRFVTEPLARTLLAAVLDQPVRRCRRDEAATAGAALVAALTLGLEGSIAAADQDWVAPYLAAAEEPDPQLAEIYTRAFEARSAAA